MTSSGHDTENWSWNDSIYHQLHCRCMLLYIYIYIHLQLNTFAVHNCIFHHFWGSKIVQQCTKVRQLSWHMESLISVQCVSFWEVTWNINLCFRSCIYYWYHNSCEMDMNHIKLKSWRIFVIRSINCSWNTTSSNPLLIALT